MSYTVVFFLSFIAFVFGKKDYSYSYKNKYDYQDEYNKEAYDRFSKVNAVEKEYQDVNVDEILAMLEEAEKDDDDDDHEYGYNKNYHRGGYGYKPEEEEDDDDHGDDDDDEDVIEKILKKYDYSYKGHSDDGYGSKKSYQPSKSYKSKKYYQPKYEDKYSNDKHDDYYGYKKSYDYHPEDDYSNGYDNDKHGYGYGHSSYSKYTAKYTPKYTPKYKENKYSSYHDDDDHYGYAPKYGHYYSSYKAAAAPKAAAEEPAAPADPAVELPEVEAAAINEILAGLNNNAAADTTAAVDPIDAALNEVLAQLE